MYFQPPNAITFFFAAAAAAMLVLVHCRSLMTAQGFVILPQCPSWFGEQERSSGEHQETFSYHQTPLNPTDFADPACCLDSAACVSKTQVQYFAPRLSSSKGLMQFQREGAGGGFDNTMRLILQFSQGITISPATAASASLGDRATEPVLAPSHPTPRLLPP